MAPNARSRLAFTDTEGIEHSIRLPTEILYVAAAIEAMAAFRRGAFAEMIFGGGTHGYGGENDVVAGRQRKKSE